jgi:hypothetical protein
MLTNQEKNLVNKVLEEAQFEKELSEDDTAPITDFVKSIVKSLNPFEKNLFNSAMKKAEPD